MQMEIDIRRYRRALWSVIGAGLLSGPVTVPVFAQSAIEEIVVTARKREESMQDVPVAVTALNQELIERQALENLADVSVSIEPFVMAMCNFNAPL